MLPYHSRVHFKELLDGVVSGKWVPAQPGRADGKAPAGTCRHLISLSATVDPYDVDEIQGKTKSSFIFNIRSLKTGTASWQDVVAGQTQKWADIVVYPFPMFDLLLARIQHKLHTLQRSASLGSRFEASIWQNRWPARFVWRFGVNFMEQRPIVNLPWAFLDHGVTAMDPV
jgi:hypothetical protein